jgi:hypothetical protein
LKKQAVRKLARQELAGARSGPVPPDGRLAAAQGEVTMTSGGQLRWAAPVSCPLIH